MVRPRFGDADAANFATVLLVPWLRMRKAKETLTIRPESA